MAFGVTDAPKVPKSRNFLSLTGFEPPTNTKSISKAVVFFSDLQSDALPTELAAAATVIIWTAKLQQISVLLPGLILHSKS